MLSRRTHVALAAVALCHAALTFWLAWQRYLNVHQRTFDLALYARAAWGLAHGDTWLPILDAHVLAAHVAPVLLPLGLLGRLFGTVPVLLLAQSLAVAACVWPIARIGARRMGSQGLWLGVVAWCLYPNLGHVTSYEFHPGTLAVLPMCWAYDALDRAKFSALVWSCLGVMACRDDFGLACVVFALLYALEHRSRKAKWLALGALVYTAAAVLTSAAYAPQNSSLSQHFGPWGGSPLGVVRTLFTDPGAVFAHFSARPRLLYLPRLLAPLSFFALRAPRLLWPALPYLALNLISVFPTSLEQYSHYLTPAVPSLVVAGVVGVTVVKKRALRYLWVATLGLSSFALGGLPWSHDFDRAAFVPDGATRAATHILADIPAGASVQAPDALLPHLIERKAVRRGPPPDAGADYVVLDVSHRALFAQREDLLRTIQEPLLRRYFARPDYGLVRYAPPYALLKKGHEPRAVLGAYRAETSGYATALTGCLALDHAALSHTALELIFVAMGPCPSDLAVRFGPDEAAKRVDLLFDGAVSPALLRAGDVLRSRHAIDAAFAQQLGASGVHVGVLRTSGARPEPSDPRTIHVAPRDLGGTTGE